MRIVLTTALLIWTAMHVYIFWRASSISVISQYVPRYSLRLLGGFLWVSYILSHFIAHFHVGVVSRLGRDWLKARPTNTSRTTGHCRVGRRHPRRGPIVRARIASSPADTSGAPWSLGSDGQSRVR